VTVEELASRLSDAGEPSGSSVAFGETVETFEACARVRDLASEQPAAARRLTPPLLAVVREMMDRKRATVESMLLGDVVERTVAVVLETVAEVSGPALVRAYEAADRPVEAVVETLAVVIREPGTERHHDRIVRPLGRLTMARPELVVDGLADANALDETVRALPADCWTTGSSHSPTAALSLALALLAHDSHPRRVNRVSQGVDAADPEPADCACLLAATVCELTATSPVGRRGGLGDRARLADRVDGPAGSVEGLATAVQDSVGSERDRFARAVGEAAAVVGHADGVDARDAGSVELPAELVGRVRASDGSERERAARALGEALTASLSVDLGVDALADRVTHTTGVEYVRSAQALGAIAKAAPGRVDASVPRVLVERVDHTTGPDRDHATQVLGEAIATAHERTEASLTDALAARVRTATSSTPRDRTARALCALADASEEAPGQHEPTPDAPLDDVAPTFGTLLAHTDADAAADARSRSADSDAFGDVPDSERDAVCRALGIAAVDVATHRETGRSPLIEQIRPGPEESRNRAARVLGEALLAGTAVGSEGVRESLATQVRRADGAARDCAARSLAVAAIAHATDHDAGAESAAGTGSAPGTESAAATELAADSEPDSGIDGLAPELVAPRERAAEAAGSRYRRLTRALGEALAREDGPADVLDVLAERAAATEGLNRAWSVRALGELVLVDTGTPSMSMAPPLWLREHARGTTGERRTWCCRAVGETVLAARADPSAGVVDALAGRVATASGMDAVRGGRALGETLAALDGHPDPPISRALLELFADAPAAERAAAAIVVADLRTHLATTTSSEPATGFVERVRATDGLERTLAARALGDHVATTDTPAVATTPPDALSAALVDGVRRGGVGREPLAAEALGLAIAATSDVDDGLSALESRLRDAVQSSAPSGSWLAARALGTAAAATDVLDDAHATPTFVKRVRSGTDDSRPRAAWGLGVAVAAPDAPALAETLLGAIDDTPNELARADVAGIVATAAEAGVLPKSALVESLPVDREPGDCPVRRTRLRDEDGTLDDSLLAALSAARDHAIAMGADVVRADIRDALAAPDEHPPAARVDAIDALTTLPTSATTTHEQ
jgi:hypothetical protein